MCLRKWVIGTFIFSTRFPGPDCSAGEQFECSFFFLFEERFSTLNGVSDAFLTFALLASNCVRSEKLGHRCDTSEDDFPEPNQVHASVGFRKDRRLQKFRAKVDDKTRRPLKTSCFHAFAPTSISFNPVANFRNYFFYSYNIFIIFHFFLNFILVFLSALNFIKIKHVLCGKKCSIKCHPVMKMSRRKMHRQKLVSEPVR